MLPLIIFYFKDQKSLFYLREEEKEDILELLEEKGIHIDEAFQVDAEPLKKLFEKAGAYKEEGICIVNADITCSEFLKTMIIERLSEIVGNLSETQLNTELCMN